MGADFAASTQPIGGNGGSLGTKCPPFLDSPTVYLRSALPAAADAFAVVLWKIGKQGIVLGSDRDESGGQIGRLG